MRSIIANRFAGNPNLSYANFGTVVDLRDNRRIATAMVTPVWELLTRGQNRER